MNPISSNLTRAQALAIAEWHMEHLDWHEGNRHDRSDRV